MRTLHGFLALACSVALASCGGGGGSATTPTTPSLPQSVHASLSFIVPVSGQPAARHGNTIPSNTQSVVVNVDQGSGQPFSPLISQVVNVSASSCPPVSGGLQCTVTMSVPVGSVIFSVGAFSGTNGGGMLLASALTPTTITPTTTSVSVPLQTQVSYLLGDTGGGGSPFTLDFGTSSFTLTDSTGSATGSFTALPDGDLKFTITSTTDPTITSGQVGYLRMIPNAGFAIIVGQTAPDPTGLFTSGGIGLATIPAPCPSGSETLQADGIALASPSYVYSGPLTQTAYATASLALTPTSFAPASGTQYTIGGTGTALSGTPLSGCTNGIFGSTSTAYAAVGLLGLGAAPGSNSSSSSGSNSNGVAFVVAPPANLVQTDVLSRTYHGFMSNATPAGQSAAPVLVTPASGGLQLCTYTTYESNQVNTSGCTVLSGFSQFAPGLFTATGSAPGGASSPWAFAVDDVDGNYVMIGVGIPSSGTAATNLVLSSI